MGERGMIDNGYQVSFHGDRFLEPDRSDGCTSLRIDQMPLNCMLRSD